MDRIEKFLLTKELMIDCIDKTDLFHKEYSIKIKNGNFCWNLIQEEESEMKKSKVGIAKEEIKQTTVLKDINMSILKGQFVAVIGEYNVKLSLILLQCWIRKNFSGFSPSWRIGLR